MKVKQNIFLLLLILVTLILVFGCANKTKELLAVNYQELSDNDLLNYYYRLNSKIEFIERPSESEVGIGLSTSYRSPYGSGVDKNTDAESNIDKELKELRERRKEILTALKERGLEP